MEVREAQSADEWEDVVSKCFTPLSCVSFESGFHGHMEHLPLGGTRTSISAVSTDGHMVERTGRMAVRSSADDIHLSMQISSRGALRQGKRMVPVRPGSITMYATDAPYYLDYSAPGQKQLIMQVSRAQLNVPRQVLADGLGRLALPTTDASRAFFSYVASLQKTARGPIGAPSTEAAEIAEDLASTMIQASAANSRIVPRTAGGLAHSIEEFIHANLASVRVDDVAAEFFTSRRSIYHLFDRLNTTPSEYIRRGRLRVAADRLIDPAQVGVAIAEVAASLGFDDATTFTRAFRREFGMTPREWRADPSRAGVVIAND